MSQFAPPQEVQATIQKANKLRSFVANPGWTDIILPGLLENKQTLEQQVIRTEWKSLDELNQCRYKLLAITQLLEQIEVAIAEADEIEKQETIRLATKAAKPQEASQTP